ncbi:molybdopterin biosynthesis protein MoeB [compost metagenome]
MKYYAVLMLALNQELAPGYLQDHLAFLEQLRLEGKVSGNGRLVDGPGGLILFRGNSLEEVKELVEQDPLVILKLRRYEIYEWAVKWAPHTGLGGIAEIQPAELKARLDRGEKTVIVDVREDDEVAEGIIPGALHIRLGELSERFEEIGQEEELYLVCRGGRRSFKACELLREKGYTGLVNVAGGMTKWNQLQE